MEIPKVYAENIFLQKLRTLLQKLNYALEKSAIPEIYAC